MFSGINHRTANKRSAENDDTLQNLNNHGDRKYTLISVIHLNLPVSSRTVYQQHLFSLEIRQ